MVGLAGRFDAGFGIDSPHVAGLGQQPFLFRHSKTKRYQVLFDQKVPGTFKNMIKNQLGLTPKGSDPFGSSLFPHFEKVSAPPASRGG